MIHESEEGQSVEHVETLVPEMRFFGSPMSAFDGDGVLFDVRVKIAIGFMQRGWTHDAAEALHQAEVLFDLAIERGYAKPLPETGDLSDAERAHLDRQVNAQTYGQVQGALRAKEAINEHAGRVHTVRPDQIHRRPLSPGQK